MRQDRADHVAGLNGRSGSPVAKIRSAIGWEPRVSLEEGLRLTLDYYEGCLEAYLE